MEEDIRKQGMLYLQQQRFGKKWKRVWCVLYRESSCSISRLEFFECKDGGERNDKSLRKQQEHKKVIRLSDCIRVAEVEMDGCPRETGPFLVETTEKIYMFAAERKHLEDWTHKLCETAFPMSWTDAEGRRGSLQRGEEDKGMEDNSLYSSRETVCDFRVCVRRTEASDRCRLRGEGVLRADQEALTLLDKTGDVLFTWPYRYLRRFGRDKSTFSFEAGRRCDSGEGSFEFETRQGSRVFQAVETAIHQQRAPQPHRQTSRGGQGSPQSPHSFTLAPPRPGPALGASRTPPLPHHRGQLPQCPPAQQAEGVYSLATEPPNLQMLQHMEKESGASSQQQRPLLTSLELPVDKTLTAVKSLTLDTYGLPVPRKNQVKMISSCPLPSVGPEPDLESMSETGCPSGPQSSPQAVTSGLSADQAYSQISLSAAEGGSLRERRSRRVAPPCAPPPAPSSFFKEPEYSLPFDTIANHVMADVLTSQLTTGGDPLYDSIDEMIVRNVFLPETQPSGLVYAKVEHIYDEPEGRAPSTRHRAEGPASVYDDPEEMKGEAWKIMGTTGEPKAHEYPGKPREDDYAVPKRPPRSASATQSTNKEVEEDKEGAEVMPGEEEELQDSPYKNVMVKMM